MYRFEPTKYYQTTDSALRLLAARGTMTQWRFRGEGPIYIRFGARGRVLYLGADLNAWLDARIIKPSPQAA